MKLISFVTGDRRAGYSVIKDSGVVDLSRRFGERTPTLRVLLASGALAEARSTLADANPDLSLDCLTFAPVIPDPDKIICVGLNYRDHVAETGKTVTANPALFARFCRKPDRPSATTRKTDRVRRIGLRG